MVGGKSLVQRGREWLRETVSTGKLQYHVGDVRRKWRLDYVLGICAWLLASALLCDKKALAERKRCCLMVFLVERRSYWQTTPLI